MSATLAPDRRTPDLDPGPGRAVRFDDPPIARLLFADPRAGWLWLPLRLYLGWSWLSSGWGKLQDPAWVESGEALRAYWENAVRLDPRPVIAVGWYRDFIQAMLDAQAYTWFAKLVVAGEVLIGIALILGAFTGIAAFLGGFLNWNFIMAGTASTNALLFAIATGLVLGWKVSGWIGLDRWLLPMLGTPWRSTATSTRSGSADGSRRPSRVEELEPARGRSTP